MVLRLKCFSLKTARPEEGNRSTRRNTSLSLAHLCPFHNDSLGAILPPFDPISSITATNWVNFYILIQKGCIQQENEKKKKLQKEGAIPVKILILYFLLILLFVILIKITAEYFLYYYIILD